MISNALGFIPQNLPSLNLDFTQGILNPALSFFRNSIGTYFDANGVMQMAAVNAPRFDYDPVTKQPLGLLIEEQRANLYSNSGSPDSWNKGSNTVRTANASMAPDGSMVPSFTNTANQNSTMGIVSTVALQNSTTYTRSLYVKCLSVTNADRKIWYFETSAGNSTYIVSAYNLANLTASAGSANATARIVNVGNGWYRLIQTFTTDSSGSPLASQNYINGYGSSADLATFAIWGAQLEQGAFATSYLPTTSAAVTRSADVIGTNVGNWYNANEGTILSECISFGGFGRGIWSFNDGTSGNKFDLRVGFTAVSVGGVARNPTISVNSTTGVINKHGYVYSPGQVSITYLSNSNTAPVSGWPTGINKLQLGGLDGSAVLPLSGYIRKLTYYPRRLSNSTLQALTL